MPATQAPKKILREAGITVRMLGQTGAAGGGARHGGS